MNDHNNKPMQAMQAIPVTTTVSAGSSSVSPSSIYGGNPSSLPVADASSAPKLDRQDELCSAITRAGTLRYNMVHGRVSLLQRANPGTKAYVSPDGLGFLIISDLWNDQLNDQTIELAIDLSSDLNEWITGSFHDASINIPASMKQV